MTTNISFWLYMHKHICAHTYPPDTLMPINNFGLVYKHLYTIHEPTCTHRHTQKELNHVLESII